MKDYHCCATCINFKLEKKNGKIKYTCGRLGFETNPKWKFNCWAIRENLKDKIKEK